MYQLPKNSKIEVRCCAQEGGPVTHLIASRIVGATKKFFLYKINGDDLQQIGVSENPQDLDKKIKWGK